MKRVAVLRGGPSEEYHVSLQSGKEVLSALRFLQYPTKDIVITKGGAWLDAGYARAPEQALQAVDVVFVALHGQFGEDGQVQRILERLGIPYVGSRAFSSAVAFNKYLTKQTLLPHGIRMPRHRKMHRRELEILDDEIPHMFAEVGSELFVKPIANGSSLGARYIPHAEALKIALEELLSTYEEVLIEEYIRGREATVGVLDNFRGEQHYVLPVIEIVPPGGQPLFSHEHKYDGSTMEICPGRFTYHEKSLLTDIARQVHQVIDCKHLSRSDFIIKDGQVYFLEVNTLPGLTRESLFPKASAAVGLQFPNLIQHLIENA